MNGLLIALVSTALGGVFTEGEPIAFSGLTGGERATDWRGREMALSEVREPGAYWVGETGFVVLPKAPPPKLPESAYYGMDAALSGISRPGNFECPWLNGDSYGVVIELLRRLGVRNVRERLQWSHVQPKKGESPRYGTFLENARRLDAHGLKVSPVFHDTVPWADPIQKLPRDLVAIHDFCRDSAAAFGGCADQWECWNEADIGFAPEPVWDYMAALRASALGFRAGGARTVLNGAFCILPWSNTYAEACFENDMDKFMDVMNYHYYGPLFEVPKFVGGIRNLLAAVGREDMELQITESGTQQEGLSTLPSVKKGFARHSPDQERVWAELYPKQQILFQQEGVSRNNFFVFGAYSERNGKKDWGVMRRDGTVKPVYATMAAMLRAVGDAKPLGEVAVGEGLRGYAFRHPDGRETLAYWRVTKLDTSGEPVKDLSLGFRKFRLPVKAGTPVRLTEPFGKTTDVVSGGELELEATRYVAYATGVTGLSVAKPAHPTGRRGATPFAVDEDPTVIVRLEFAKDDVSIAGGKTIAEMAGPTAGVRLVVWNLSEQPKRGRLALTGGSFAGLPDEMTLPARGAAAFDTVFSLGGSPADVDVRLSVGGEFEGRRVIPTVVKIHSVPRLNAQCRMMSLGCERPERWRRNTNADVCEITYDAKEKAVRFDMKWTDPSKGPWFYPFYNLAADEKADDVLSVEFEVKSVQDKVENDFSVNYVMADSEKGKSEWVRYKNPATGWERRHVALAGKRGRLKTLRIGGNPRGSTCTFWIRRVRVGTRLTAPVTNQLTTTVVAAGTPTEYQGHPTTAMLADGKTVFCVWPTGHGGYAGKAALSKDGGLSWHRVDERLPAGAKMNVECPLIHRLVGPDGKSRLWVWSGFRARTLEEAMAPVTSELRPIASLNGAPMPALLSEDDGLTWREMPPKGPEFRCVLSFQAVVRLKDGSYLGVYHRGVAGCQDKPPLELVSSVTRDGGFTWDAPRVIARAKGLDFCEPWIFRSPDGQELCCLIRENHWLKPSKVMFSRDEGRTWTEPRDVPPGLTGHRHQGVVLPDGRIVVCMRDTEKDSPTLGHFIAWIGSYESIRTGKPSPGDRRIKLLHSYAGADCGYAGVHLLPDGKTVLATTYIKYRPDNCKQSIVAVRFVP